jgi:hypothetical protein
MKQLLGKKYRTLFILNVAGIIFTMSGWILNELHLEGKIWLGGSNILLVGIILWFAGEIGLIISLLKRPKNEE